MTNILATVSTISNMNVTQGNMKLQITVSGDTDTFLWMYTQNGIDYQAKGLQMTFQNNVLTLMSTAISYSPSETRTWLLVNNKQ